MSVIDFLLKDKRYNELHLPKINSLVICGYSFGAMIANSIQCDIPCSYILVSLPLGVMWALATTKAGFFKQHLSQNLKVLCIHGDSDQFTGLNRYKMWCKGHEDHIDDVTINGADHFWFDYESHLIKEIENWRLKQLSN
jgi:alpha/beta superfamily hydrolase